MGNESTASLKVNSVVLCDDIRREDNGKTIIIGAYNGTIVCRSLPLRMRSLGIWIEVIGSKPATDCEFSLRIIDGKSRPILESQGTMDVVGVGPGLIGFVAPGITLETKGKHRLQLKTASRYRTIYEFDVAVNHSSS